MQEKVWQCGSKSEKGIASLSSFRISCKNKGKPLARTPNAGGALRSHANCCYPDDRSGKMRMKIERVYSWVGWTAATRMTRKRFLLSLVSLPPPLQRESKTERKKSHEWMNDGSSDRIFSSSSLSSLCYPLFRFFSFCSEGSRRRERKTDSLMSVIESTEEGWERRERESCMQDASSSSSSSLSLSLLFLSSVRSLSVPKSEGNVWEKGNELSKLREFGAWLWRNDDGQNDFLCVAHMTSCLSEKRDETITDRPKRASCMVLFFSSFLFVDILFSCLSFPPFRKRERRANGRERGKGVSRLGDPSSCSSSSSPSSSSLSPCRRKKEGIVSERMSWLVVLLRGHTQREERGLSWLYDLSSCFSSSFPLPFVIFFLWWSSLLFVCLFFSSFLISSHSSFSFTFSLCFVQL